MENQGQNTPGLEKLFARLEEVTADMESQTLLWKSLCII